YATTHNENHANEIEVTRRVEDTTIRQITQLVEEAQEEKAPSEAFIDRFANIYKPVVFALALFDIVVPPLFGFGTWGDWTYKGLALLVVVCPCCLVVLTPVAIVFAYGHSAIHVCIVCSCTLLLFGGIVN